MKRAAALAVAALFLSGLAAAQVDAEIAPADPDDIVLDGDYNENRTFDGSGSTGANLTYSWLEKDTSTSRSGPEAEFQFDRDNSQTVDVELTVSNGTDSDSTSVTQVLRDVSEVEADDPSQSVDFGDSSTTKTYQTSDYTVNNSFDDPLSYSWTVEDPGGSTSTASGSSVDVEFDTEGTYEINLTAEDAAGYTGFDTIQVDASNTSESGGGGGDGGGSGGGSTGVTTTDTAGETEALGLLVSGQQESASFGLTAIARVAVNASSTVANNVKLTVQEHAELPDEAGSEPDGNVYQYIEVEKTGIEDGEIGDVSFQFEVESSWIEDNNVDPETVELNRWSDGWQPLGAELVEEGEDHYSYNASSANLSVFSVTGEEGEASFEVVSLDVQESNGTVTVDVEVENTGDFSGSYEVSFDLAGESLSDTLELDAGETGSAQFETSVEEPGTYDVSVGSLSEQVTVQQEEGSDQGSQQQDEEEQVAEEPAGSGFPWLPVIGVVLLVLLLTAVSVHYLNTDEGREKLDRLLDRLEGGEEEPRVQFEGFGDPDDDSFP